MEPPQIAIIVHAPPSGWLKQAARQIVESINARYYNFNLRAGERHVSEDEVIGIIAGAMTGT